MQAWFSLAQRVEPVLCLPNAASECLRVVLACFRRLPARSLGAPCGQNDGIIGLREHKACLCVAALGGAFEHDPRRTDVALAKQRIGTRDQFGHFRITLRFYGFRRWRPAPPAFVSWQHQRPFATERPGPRSRGFSPPTRSRVPRHAPGPLRGPVAVARQSLLSLARPW